MTFEIVLPEEIDPALALFARAVERSLARTHVCAVSTSDVGSPDRFLLTYDAGLATVVLTRHDASARVESRGREIGTIPFVLPRSSPAERRPSRLRVAFAGGSSYDRRLRMTARSIAEGRKRKLAFETSAAGPLPPEWPRAASPDHLFDDLTPDEMLRLVLSSSCVLECGDEQELPTSLAIIAAAVGTPVVVRRTSSLALRRPESVITVDEWSADAFVDAFSGALRDVAPMDTDPGSELLQILELPRA